VRPRGEAHAPPLQPAHAPAGAQSKHAPSAGTANGSGANGKAPKRKPKPKGPSKNRLSAQQRAEQAIEAAEASLRELEAELTDPAAWATRYEAAKSEARHTAATRAVEAAYARLEALVD
jgi:hypothetical protein